MLVIHTKYVLLALRRAHPEFTDSYTLWDDFDILRWRQTTRRPAPSYHRRPPPGGPKSTLGPTFIVFSLRLFLSFVFGTVYCDFGLRFEVQNGSQISKNRSPNTLWFPASFRNRFLIDFCRFLVASRPQNLWFHPGKITISEKSPFSSPDPLLERCFVI